MTETSGTSSKLLGAVTSSVKMAANTLRLKNPDPEYATQAKYFEGKLQDPYHYIIVKRGISPVMVVHDGFSPLHNSPMIQEKVLNKLLPLGPERDLPQLHQINVG